jgi:hypothetical protein
MGEFSMFATGSVRNYLSSQHLWTAEYSARRCAPLEEQLRGTGVPTHPELRGYAITAITLSVAFLEALVNEVFEDADRFGHRVETLPVETARLMTTFWSDGERYVGTLEKFQRALLFKGAEKFARGTDPLQGAAILIQLRNALSHFKPGWHMDERPKAMNKRLPGLFAKSSLLSDNDGSDWSIWALATPGANWAVKTARYFADEWSDRMGLPRHYEADLANFERQFGSR